MSRLLLRFFVSFWLTIALTFGAAAALGFYYAERAHAAIARFEVSDAVYDAGAALRSDGRDGLAEWLESLPGVTGSLIYVVDQRGKDILGRRLPAAISIALRRFGDRRRGGRPDRANIRRARPFTELVGPDGAVYTVFVLPPRGTVGNWLTNRGLPTLIFLAVVLSAAASWFLAGTISRPIRELRSSAMSLAAGRLDTRVASDVLQRHDEIGLLARDFDRMARELQRASHRQTELTRNVSHELRSPLARVRVALELARRKTGELHELDKIDGETERLDALIGQILEFSKLDAEHHDTPLCIDVIDMIHALADDLRFEFGDDVSVTVSCATDRSVHVQGFEHALRSCLENVLRNAARHGGPGGTIDVAVEQGEFDVVITIQDDGGGVAPGDLEHLFEPFYRAARHRSGPRPPGSGLGLAIAHRAIALHGGSIAAHNQDEGLRVTIRLPAAPPPLPNSGNAE